MTTSARQLGAGLTKQVRAHVVKAAGQAGSNLKPGQFSAIVSVFNNVDSYGDVMMPGAFRNTLAAYAASGYPIPVLWSHDWINPESHIGEVLEAEEVPAAKFSDDSPAGLWVLGQNDIEENDRARYVSRLMAGGRITQFSFAYDEIAAGWGIHDGMEAWLVHEVGLHEVGPTLVGVNRDTHLVGAKAIIDLAARARAGAKLPEGDMRMLATLRSALVDAGAPATVPDHVPSDQNGTKSDSQGSTDGTTDAGNGDGGGASTLRAADVMMLIDLAIATDGPVD